MRKQTQDQSLKILFLRKLIRLSQRYSKCRSFAKFGIGIVKYEICSNIKEKKQFQYISTFCKNSNTLKIYSIASSQFDSFDVDIQKSDLTFTQIEQIHEDTLLLSGGKNLNPKRFTLYSEKSIQEFEMQSRFCHNTRFNKRNLIFIISGAQTLNDQDTDLIECETFSTQSNKFNSIKNIQKAVQHFGCDQTDLNLYTFGGNTCEDDYQDIIQRYDSKKNE